MERILAVLNREETALSVLRVAEAVATRITPSRISVLSPRLPEDPSFMPTEEIMTDERRRQFNQASGQQAERLRAIFATWQSAYPAGKDAHWLEVIGEAQKIVGAEASQADLIVIGHVMDNDPDNVRVALKAALFDTSAPVIVAPALPPETVGAHPAIAWERTQAVEEAVSAALPILIKAERVTVLICHESGSRTASEPPGLMEMLRGAHVPGSIKHFDLHGEEIGAALLAEAHRHGADLLVMGAYTHSAFVERMIGGATADLLAHAGLPLFMHH